jgi:hypothetical protein
MLIRSTFKSHKLSVKGTVDLLGAAVVACLVVETHLLFRGKEMEIMTRTMVHIIACEPATPVRSLIGY